MNRRSFLSLLAATPLLAWLRPSRPSSPAALPKVGIDWARGPDCTVITTNSGTTGIYTYSYTHYRSDYDGDDPQPQHASLA